MSDNTKPEGPYTIQRIDGRYDNRPLKEGEEHHYFCVVDATGRAVGTPCTRPEYCESERDRMNTAWRSGRASVEGKRDGGGDAVPNAYGPGSPLNSSPEDGLRGIASIPIAAPTNVFTYEEVVSILVDMRDWMDCDDEKEGDQWRKRAAEYGIELPSTRRMRGDELDDVYRLAEARKTAVKNGIQL